MNTLLQPKPNLNIFDFSSREQALQACQDIIDSDLCPKWAKGKPGNVLLVLMTGFEIGLSVTQSLKGLAPINGIVSMYGDVLLGYCLALPNREYIEEDYCPKTRTYVCVSKRKDRRKEVERQFSMVQAEKAGLLKKEGPWRQYPERMCQMRPRSWSLRDNWTDKLMGIMAYEEALDCTPSCSNTVDFQSKILEGTKEYLTFLIQHNQLPQERIQKMLTWANVESIDLMSELKAMQAINALRKENPEAINAWQDVLVARLETMREGGESRA